MIEKEIDINDKKRKTYQKREKELQKQKSSLIQMRSVGEITSEELIELKNNLTNELIDLNEKIQELNKKDDVLISNLDKTVELLVELQYKRKLLSKEQKLDTINYMVVELLIDDKKGLHIVENSLFKALRKGNCLKWWSIITELRTFFEKHQDFSITELYVDKYNDYYEYKWKPKEYYQKQAKKEEQTH